jgi:hypothetical protein
MHFNYEIPPAVSTLASLKNSCNHFKDKTSLRFRVIRACNFRLLPVVA